MNRTQWGLLGALFFSFSLLVHYDINSTLMRSVAVFPTPITSTTTREVEVQVQVQAAKESGFGRTLSLRGTNDPTNSSTNNNDVSNNNNGTIISISIPIIVDLTGELGNQLHHLAHGRAIQSMLWQQYGGIASHIIPRRVSNGDKYMKTQRQLKQCFPNLRPLTFYGPGTSTAPKQTELDRAQQAWLGTEAAAPLVLHRGSGYNETLQGLDALMEILRDDNTVLQATKPILSSSIISLPFLHTKSMTNRDFMDRMYDDYRDYFRFDDEACCADDLPDPNESVFHFRNFLAEFRSKNNQQTTGLEELSPHKVATEVFRNSNNNNATTTTKKKKKIAIVTRYPERSRTVEYLETLQQHGFETRLLSRNHSAVQDFCAMQKAPELVGMVRSTFVLWAAVLGHGTARLYSVDSPATRRKYNDTTTNNNNNNKNNNKMFFRDTQWTHPELQRRIHFELYQQQTDDGLEGVSYTTTSRK
jgi:hypothetical protein